MKHVQETNDGFVSLWPTKLLKRTLPDAQAANQELARLIEELDSKHRDLTTDYRSDDLFTNEHLAAVWLRDCVNVTVSDCEPALTSSGTVKVQLSVWAAARPRRTPPSAASLASSVICFCVPGKAH